VFFKPLGLYHFFGADMKALTNKTVDLHEFLGFEIANKLISSIKSCSNITAQIDTLNNYFSQINAVYDVNVLQPAIDYIDVAQGSVSIKQMEEDLSITKRTLERYFNTQVGISPKLYAQIFRFKCTMQFLQANPQATWAQITYENGFSDQSHLIKYFKDYLKVSPSNLVTLDNDFINYLLRN
jgi:AraC-like DNA-binding protein